MRSLCVQADPAGSGLIACFVDFVCFSGLCWLFFPRLIINVGAGDGWALPKIGKRRAIRHLTKNVCLGFWPLSKG